MTTILDRDLSIQLTEEGIAAADRVDNPFRESLEQAITYLAQENPYVYSDMVWEYLGFIPSHAQASALGPILRRAARDGKIVRDESTLTDRPSQHRRVIRRWRSLTYKDGPVESVTCPTCGK